MSLLASRRLRLALAAGGLLVALLGVWFVPLPRIVALRFGPPRTTAFLEARRERLRAEGKKDAIDRRPVPLAEVSPELVRAVIAAEDARFFEHHGVDWEAVAAAREHNRRARAARSNRREAGKKKPRLHGASTLTQQLAKNLYLSPERSLFRKAREAAIAYALETVLTKQRILEHYLSAIEWGERVYGCEAAARTYFGVSAARLNAGQAAWLAAMIPSPRRYLADPARHQRRAARIARFARQAGPLPPGALPEDDD